MNKIGTPGIIIRQALEFLIRSGYINNLGSPDIITR